MRTFGKLALAFGMVALMSAPCWAQGRGGFGGGGGGAMLLTNKGVQQELKVTDSQAEKLNAFAAEVTEKHRDDFAKLRDMEPEERRSKMQDLNKTIQAEIKKGLADILKPEQAKRFHQVQLQAGGINAFTMPHVQEGLKLTEEQKSKIATINEETMAAMREARTSAGDDREAAMKKSAEIRKSALEQVHASLTDDQKKAWMEMTGAPYEVKFEPRPPQN